MSSKLFYKCNDRIYISSYRKANIRALAEHCINDINKLNRYIHKILLYRLYVIKYVFLYSIKSLMHSVILTHRSTMCGLFIRVIRNLIDFRINASFYICHDICIYNISNSFYNIYGIFIGYHYISLELYKFSIFYKKGISSLPNKISKYTVLRSPHTDKKSREQFCMRTRRKVYMFPTLLTDYYSFLCDSNYSYFLCSIIKECNILCYE